MSRCCTKDQRWTIVCSAATANGSIVPQQQRQTETVRTTPPTGSYQRFVFAEAVGCNFVLEKQTEWNVTYHMSDPRSCPLYGLWGTETGRIKIIRTHSQCIVPLSGTMIERISGRGPVSGDSIDFFLFVLLTETICDALALSDFIIFLSKFYSSPQILTRCLT